MELALDKLTERLTRVEVQTHVGQVIDVTDQTLRAVGLSRLVKVGDHLRVLADGSRYEVTQLGDDTILAEPLERASRPPLGARVRLQSPIRLHPGPEWFGQRVDGFGRNLSTMEPAPSLQHADHPPSQDQILTGHYGVDMLHPLPTGGIVALHATTARARAHLFGTLAAHASKAPVIWLRLGAWREDPVPPKVIEMVGLPSLTSRGLRVTLGSGMTVTQKIAKQGFTPLLIVEGLALGLQASESLANGLALIRHSLHKTAACIVALTAQDCARPDVEAHLSGTYVLSDPSELGEPQFDLNRSWSLAEPNRLPDPDAVEDVPDLQSWRKQSLGAGTVTGDTPVDSLDPAAQTASANQDPEGSGIATQADPSSKVASGPEPAATATAQDASKAPLAGLS
ncbi:MAG: hypothetical protein AAGA78_01055 [Pseudomonadota bacterium]